MRTLFFSLLLWISTSAAYAQDTVAVKHMLKKATVYLQNAELIHEGKINLGAGTHVLVFEQLPLEVFENSIQLQMQGNATLLSVKYEVNYLQNNAQKAEIEALRQQMLAAEAKVARLQATKESIEEEQSLLLSNKKIGGANNGLTAEQLRQMADFYGQHLLSLKNRLFDTERALKEAQEEHRRLKAQLNARARRKPTGEVKAIVRCTAPATLQLSLRYLVRGAAWYPVYDLRVADAGAPVELSYKAMVMQKTGTDWDNISLSLSTGNPSISGTKPELSPWFLDFITTPYSSYRDKGTKKESDATPAPALMEGPPPMEAESTTLADFTKVNESGLQVLFEVGMPVSIPGDGKEQLVDIQKHKVEASYDYAAVPKVASEAFLMAKIHDWAELNLLPGEANVYFAGNYVGTTSLDPGLTGDTLAFSLGRDARVICTRKEIKDFTGKRFLKNDIEEEHAYEISVRNNRKESITLTVEDQIPVSKQNRISVEALELSGGKLDPQTGIVRWQITLAPGREEKKMVRFKVKYPKGSKIRW